MTETTKTPSSALLLLWCILVNASIVGYCWNAVFDGDKTHHNLHYIAYISLIPMIGAMFQAGFAGGAMTEPRRRLFGAVGLILSLVFFGVATILFVHNI